jgi:DNA repair protein RecO
LEDFLESIEQFKKNDNAEEKAKLVTLGFLFKLLNEQGYKLAAERCSGCDKKLEPAGNYFSAARGGVLCPQCQKNESRKLAISSEAIKLLRIFLNNKMKNLNKLKVSLKEIQILSAILKDFLQWISI